MAATKLEFGAKVASGDAEDPAGADEIVLADQVGTQLQPVLAP